MKATRRHRRYPATPKQPLDINDSYPERMTPQKSRNPILWILDYMCQRDGDSLALTNLTWFWIASLVPAAILYEILLKFDINAPWILSVYVLAFIPIDEVYRFFRHSYFKKHHLPGPYGWGTLDRNPSYTYNNPVNL